MSWLRASDRRSTMFRIITIKLCFALIPSRNCRVSAFLQDSHAAGNIRFFLSGSQLFSNTFDVSLFAFELRENLIMPCFTQIKLTSDEPLKKNIINFKCKIIS